MGAVFWSGCIIGNHGDKTMPLIISVWNSWAPVHPGHPSFQSGPLLFEAEGPCVPHLWQYKVKKSTLFLSFLVAILYYFVSGSALFQQYLQKTPEKIVDAFMKCINAKPKRKTAYKKYSKLRPVVRHHKKLRRTTTLLQFGSPADD